MKLDPRAGAGRPVSPRAFRALSHSWGLGIGLLAVWACLSFFLLPGDLGSNPAVREQFGSWDDGYYAMYGVAGVAILAGLSRRYAPVEAFGLCLFIAGLCVNLAALVATFGALHVIGSLGAWLGYVGGALGRLVIVAHFVRERPITLDDLDELGGD